MVVFKFRNLKTGQAMPIPAGEFLVGRADEAYVHVDDVSVSRNHARILNQDDGFFIEDLGSANGTALRGAYLTTRAPINYGDVVHIGSVAFRIDPEVTGEVEPEPKAPLMPRNFASMRRPTERLPNIGEAPWTPPSIPQDKLAAPEVSSTDSDAEMLNAITIREPQPPITGTPPQSQPQPTKAPSSSARSIPRQTVAVTPALISERSVAPHQYPRQQLVIPEAEGRGSSPQMGTESLPQENKPPPNTLSRIWYVVIFFAGLGAGLLAGLIFAKIFFELGGKPAGLP